VDVWISVLVLENSFYVGLNCKFIPGGRFVPLPVLSLLRRISSVLQTGQKKAFPFSASFGLSRLPLLSIAIVERMSIIVTFDDKCKLLYLKVVECRFVLIDMGHCIWITFEKDYKFNSSMKKFKITNSIQFKNPNS